jgi:hypothetical protein
MELDPDDRVRNVSNSHGDPVLCPGFQSKTIPDLICDERVVSGTVEGVGNVLVETLAGVVYGRGLAVDADRCLDGPATEDLVDALHPEAHAEQRDLRTKAFNDLTGHAGILRPFRARGDHDPIGTEPIDLCEGEAVVPVHLHFRAHLGECLYEIEGEGIIVVDKQGLHGAQILEYFGTPVNDSTKSFAISTDLVYILGIWRE